MQTSLSIQTLRKSRFNAKSNQTTLIQNLSQFQTPPSYRTLHPIPLKRGNTTIQLPKITNRSASNRVNSHHSIHLKSEQNPDNNYIVPITPQLGSPQMYSTLLDLDRVHNVQYSSTGQCAELKEKQNQDSIITALHPNYHLYGVCDGHGSQGHQVSQFISTQLVKNIDTGMNNNQYMLQYNTRLHRHVIRSAFLKTSEDLHQTNINIHKSGSTCNLVVLVQQNIITGPNIELNQEYQKETILYCANVGDSRSIIITVNDYERITSTQLSCDHKPDLPEEKNRILQRGGHIDFIYNNQGQKVGPPRVWLTNKSGLGLAMSRSFGDVLGQSVGIISEPTITEHRVRENDKYLVIASDGIWDCLSNKEVAKIVYDSKGDAQFLVEKAKERWKEGKLLQDDITCKIVYLN